MEIEHLVQDSLTLQPSLFPLDHDALWDVCRFSRTTIQSSSYSLFSWPLHTTPSSGNEIGREDAQTRGRENPPHTMVTGQAMSLDVLASVMRVAMQQSACPCVSPSRLVSWEGRAVLCHVKVRLRVAFAYSPEYLRPPAVHSPSQTTKAEPVRTGGLILNPALMAVCMASPRPTLVSRRCQVLEKGLEAARVAGKASKKSGDTERD